MKNLNFKLMLGMTALFLIGCGDVGFQSTGKGQSRIVAGANDPNSGLAGMPGGLGTSGDSGAPVVNSGGGSSNPVAPNAPVYNVPAPTSPPPGGSGDPGIDFLRTVHREIFRYTQYDHSIFDPSAVLAYWRNRYNPSAGIGCRAIVQAFLLATPLRANAIPAFGVYASGPDAALTSYIEMQYRALLPGVDPGSNFSGPKHNIYNWYVGKLITMDQLDAIFLDHPLLKNRCQAGGFAF